MSLLILGVSLPFSVKLLIFFPLAFFAILFLQSGLDKFMDRAGNLEYFKSQFKDSPLASRADELLSVITYFELATGAICALAALAAIVAPSAGGNFSFIAFCFATTNLLALFFGQRMARDYQGAAGITPYFLVAMLGLVMSVSFAI